jgi:indole-3-glycerol phosphate synthase
MDILERILVQKRKRLSESNKALPLNELIKLYENKKSSLEKSTSLDLLNLSVSSRKWLLIPGRFHVVAEIKRASPSKGTIPWPHTLEEILQGYEKGGASLISVLTEEDFFLGGILDFKEVRSLTHLPLLRKDFIFTEYQVYESALIGADALLLIASILNDDQLKKLHQLAQQLGLRALVECRDEMEIHRALNAGATLLGINNRDLRTFEINLKRTEELSRHVPSDCILISESGIHSPQDAGFVSKYGADAILVGESCVRSEHPEQHIEALLKAGQNAVGQRKKR